MAQKLINLLQISGGKKLQETVQAIEKSYPADKVTTTTAKKVAEGQAPATYTAQELLTELKNSMDKLTDGSNGSISDQIKTAKEEVVKMVDDINNREILDNVRIFIDEYSSKDDVTVGSLTQSEYNTLNVEGAGTVATKDGKLITLSQEDLQKFQLDTPYIVYSFRNTPILNEFKKNITATFTKDATSGKITIKFNDVPVTFSTTKTTKSIEGEESTLESDLRTISLTQQYWDDSASIIVKDSTGKIIDASEYYVKSLSGKIMFKKEQVAGSKYTVSYSYFEYSETVTKQPSFTAELVKDASGNVTSAKPLLWKIFPVKSMKFSELSSDYLLDNSELNQISMQNSINELSEKLTNETDIVEQIVAKVGEASIQNALTTITNELSKRLDQAEKAINDLKSYFSETFNPTDKQTLFNLSHVPASKLVDCYINGIKYFENTYFTIDRTTVGTDGNKGYKPSLTWLFTSDKEGFDLGPDFEVVLEYLIDNDKAMYSATANS